MGVFRNRATGALIAIMIALVVVGYIIAKVYYSTINKSVDPRVVPARELYAGYGDYAREGNYYNILDLLDSVESIYESYPHYSNSYEIGVINNNRAAAIITISLFSDSIPEEYNPFIEIPSDSLLTIAELNINKAIGLYNNWLGKYRDKSEEEIIQLIEPEFVIGMDNTEPDLIRRYMEARAEEITESVGETERRLSVCYTNLGVIKRQRKEYKEAIQYYEKALELWSRNLSAENNLNALLGRPIRKRNLIQKLFPPEK